MKLKSTKIPVDLMIDQPIEWLRVCLPKMEAATQAIIELMRKNPGQLSLDEARTMFLEQRWRELSGVSPEDTHFTIVIPVHEEVRLLSSFLGAFLVSELPWMADIQIIFIVNASGDQSATLIKDRLAFIHAPTETILPPSDFDQKRSDIAYQVSQDKIRFLVVETLTAGKANALNIGNELARWQDHAIAINIDANNWVEPDSVALLYGRAKRAIQGTRESNVVLVNTQEYCLKRHTQIDVSVKVKTQKAEVTGCLFAWSTHWIRDNGGFPQKAIEDYGTGLLALSQKKRIVESEAKIWGYCVSNFLDENKELIRFIYGAMQLSQRFENDSLATEILLEDFPHLRPVGKRLEYYLSIRCEKQQPVKFIRGVLRWLFNELLILKARQMLRRSPYGQTWDPIRSTKWLQ